MNANAGNLEVLESALLADIAASADEQAIEDEVRRAGPRTALFALVPEHISGKRVNES